MYFGHQQNLEPGPQPLITILENPVQTLGRLHELLKARNLAAEEITAYKELKEPLPALLQKTDGIILLGRDPNVHPKWYSGSVPPGTDEAKEYDLPRDEMSRTLIREALERKIPILGVCGGAQEMQAFYGGPIRKLEPIVGEILPGKADLHNPKYRRSSRNDHSEYIHDVLVVPGGMMQGMFGAQKKFGVNSAHGEGILRHELAAPYEAGLVCAETGIVESFKHRGHPFFVGVQFHPERFERMRDGIVETPAYHQIFNCFADAARTHQDSRFASESTGRPVPRRALAATGNG